MLTKSKLPVRFGLALLVVCVSGPANSQDNPAIQQGPGAAAVAVRISGTLSDFARAPIGGATIGVAAWPPDSPWQPLAKTAPDGAFDIRVRLQRGGYRLIAGFGSFEVAQSMFTVEGRSPITVKLAARAFDAKSDALPKPVPPVGLLPRGSMAQTQLPVNTASGTVAPIRKPGDQELVNVFYVTNRQRTGRGGVAYGQQPDPKGVVSYGVSSVSIPPVHQPGRLERPTIWRIGRVEDVNQHIVITRTVSVPQAAFRQRLRAAFSETGTEAFLFIHGYNVDFEDSVRRTAQLFRDLSFNGVPLLFSWPGQDAWWRYPAAEDVVGTSARVLEGLIVDLLRTERLSAVNVVAHSMGNRVLAAALERMALRQVNPGFRNLVLAAPDINIADFSALSEVLRASAARTTIYSSSRDVALQVSKAFHSYQRLGEAPPKVLDARIDTVDVSAIPRDVLGHSYFGDSATVLRDLFLLIRQGLDPAKRFLRPMALGEQRYWLVPKE